jgi:hypothetical protein
VAKQLADHGVAVTQFSQNFPYFPAIREPHFCFRLSSVLSISIANFSKPWAVWR